MRKLVFCFFLFITALFGVKITSIVGVNKQKFEQNSSTSIVLKEKNSKTLFCFNHEVEEKLTTSDFFSKEYELYDDYELEGSVSYWNLSDSRLVYYKNQKSRKNQSFSLGLKSIPLYDLYCQWKQHLI